MSSSSSSSSSSSDEAKFHVLAVDDSVIDRKLIERLLKTCSYQVTAVESGMKAMEVLGKEIEGVNLIITDYSMPGMTGYELLRKVKGCSSLRDIPVVIMSSEDLPSRIDRCLQDGAEEFFLKPVCQSDVNKLRSHLIRRPSSTVAAAAEAEEEVSSLQPQQQQNCRKRKAAAVLLEESCGLSSVQSTKTIRR
ncbi:hypothetical protein DM860_014606 [Cuscuta australis]|uniref:Response regulatory domain-containing protein n=1 Tax=Cuscuta australis TaxID=267555 RepID=A0A328DIC0_9ASTE|nr:hypothetical protein DM860_014606 [Cuscuta australis]